MNDELRAGSEAAPLRAAFPARRPDMHEAEAKAARTIRARATPGRPYCTSVATRRLSQPQERSEACAPSEGGSQPTPLTTSEWAAGTGRAASVERSTREREPEGQCRGHVGDASGRESRGEGRGAVGVSRGGEGRAAGAGAQAPHGASS